MTGPVGAGQGVFRLTALGSTFVVRGASVDATAGLRQQWSRLASDTTSERPEVIIDLGSVVEEQHGRALLSQVTIRAIEAAAGTRLMLHAAGLADARGRVLALVGPSGMGKTTASVYLSQRGYGYVTDETVSIGRSGDVLPFPRPLSLRRPDGEVQRSPDQLGMREPSGELNIARIVLLNRNGTSTEPPTLRSVPLVDALLSLIPHASAFAKLPAPLQCLSKVIDRCGGVLELTYAHLDEAVLSLLAELLGADLRASYSWNELLPARASRDGSGSMQPVSVKGRRLFTGPIRDGIVSRGEALVLVDDIPIRLGEIGLTIWRAARSGVRPKDVVSVVEKQHGAHPDAARIVREAVQEMLRAGVLVAEPEQFTPARTTRLLP